MSRSDPRWDAMHVALACAPRARAASALHPIGASKGRGEPVRPTEVSA